MRLRRIISLFSIPLLIFFFSCGKEATGWKGDRIKVFVSILPQKYFVERIGDDLVDVEVMVKPGANPATYEPKPKQMRMLAEADLYMSIGVPFENVWMRRIRAANPRMQVVDTTIGIERLPIEGHRDEDEARFNLDPHIWLSPKLVKLQAQTIRDALIRIDPDNKEKYRSRCDVFLDEIDRLDSDIRALLSGIENRKFMVFHPSWGYFARDYGLEMRAIEVGGQEPSVAELARLIKEAKQEGIKVIFAQPEFSTQKAQTIADEIGGRVVLISPLDLNWTENLRRAAQAIADALRK